MKLATAAIVVVAAIATATALACGAGKERDVVPQSRDVRVEGAADPRTQSSRNANDPEAYEYVARRKLGTVALAEGRGVAPDVAARAVDVLADLLQICAADLEKTGKLVRGATRVVAQIEPDGSVHGLKVTVSSGKAAAANAILCVIAPVRGLTFPAAGDAGARGIAIEAAWEGTASEEGAR